MIPHSFFSALIPIYASLDVVGPPTHFPISYFGVFLVWFRVSSDASVYARSQTDHTPMTVLSFLSLRLFSDHVIGPVGLALRTPT